MEQLLQRLRNQPLSQQLALAAAGCCLLATLTLVGVAAQSTQSIQNATLAEHADAAVVVVGQARHRRTAEKSYSHAEVRQTRLKKVQAALARAQEESKGD